jgi:superfamily II DNA or RNA helicase
MARKQLRERQEQAIVSLRSSLASGNKRVVVKAPTGFGKTVVAAEIIHLALAKGRRVMFVADAISLIDQTAKSFIDQGIPHVGIIQAQHELTDPSAPVQVCSVQTLLRRKYLPDADLVLIDECHVWFKFYETWMKRWDRIPFIGLSATPYTKGLGKHYQDLIQTATTQQLIDEGLLADFKVFAPYKPDLTGVKTVGGDYSDDDLSKVMNNAHLVAGIVEWWQKIGQNRPTFCYAVDCAHAKAIQKAFADAGIAFGYMDAYTDRDERDELKREFHDRRIAGVVSVGCLIKGIDWDVRCIILARPTKSDSTYQQIIGRGLRTASGKDHLLIIDHSSTTLRLGFVTDVDERHEHLDTGKKQESKSKEREEPLPKECPKCHFLKPPKVWECPQCGCKPERQPMVSDAEGELKELTRSQKINNKHATSDEKLLFYGQLLFYCNERGKKPGYAANIYRRKFGVWPNKYKHAPLLPPTPDTISYIRANNIRYAKGASGG